MSFTIQESQDVENFATTEQSNLINILSSADSAKLYDRLWEDGDLISKVTRVDKDTHPIVLSRKGWAYRVANVLTKQISAQDISDAAQITPELRSVTFTRFNTRSDMTVSYEASHQPFIKSSVTKALLNANICSIERAILYGSGGTHKGIIPEIGFWKKNWTYGGAAPQGSGGWFHVQGIYPMFQAYMERGYRLEDANFFMGTKAFAQLMVYGVSGGARGSFMQFKDRQATAFGIPVKVLSSLNDTDIIFGDFSNIFLKVLDVSHEYLRLPSNSSLKITANSAILVGWADKDAFFAVQVAKTNHDNNA